MNQSQSVEQGPPRNLGILRQECALQNAKLNKPSAFFQPPDHMGIGFDPHPCRTTHRRRARHVGASFRWKKPIAVLAQTPVWAFRHEAVHTMGVRSTPTSSVPPCFVSSPWAPFSDAGARRRAPRRSLAASPSQSGSLGATGRPRCHGRTRSTETASKGQRPLVQRPQKWRPSGQSTSLGGGDMACPGPRPRRVGMAMAGAQHSVLFWKVAWRCPREIFRADHQRSNENPTALCIVVPAMLR